MNYTFSPFVEAASSTYAVSAFGSPCACPDCDPVKIARVPQEGDVACDRCHRMFTPTPAAYVDNTVHCHRLGAPDGDEWKDGDDTPGPFASQAGKFILASLFGMTMDDADTLLTKGEVTSYRCLCPNCRPK